MINWFIKFFSIEWKHIGLKFTQIPSSKDLQSNEDLQCNTNISTSSEANNNNLVDNDDDVIYISDDDHEDDQTRRDLSSLQNSNLLSEFGPLILPTSSSIEINKDEVLLDEEDLVVNEDSSVNSG